MTFMEKVLKKNTPIWNECAATPFVRELRAGTLPMEKFKLYIIQDSIYLKHYARVYGDPALLFGPWLRDRHGVGCEAEISDPIWNDRRGH